MVLLDREVWLIVPIESRSQSDDADVLKNDPRWQLVERISASDPFRKSDRFRNLLRYVAEQAIKGHPDNLAERVIGRVVFDKEEDYSPTEDSSVRVHLRQLRLKLHEYFDTTGRNETIFMEIPKGGFIPIFQDIRRRSLPAPAAGSLLDTEGPAVSKISGEIRRKPWLVPLLFSIMLLLGMATALLLIERHSDQGATTPPWPLSALFDQSATTTIVTADVNYAMLDLLYQRHRSLQEYLAPATRANLNLPESDIGERALIEYIEKSSLTSSADASIAARLGSVFGGFHGHIVVRSARDLRPRDFDNGNFIIVGSFMSNPWASMFENQLNFEETIDPHNLIPTAWKNKSPGPGEQTNYECLFTTGSTGADYADIALLPGHGSKDAILLLQGCKQEGTESTLTYLANAKGQRDLLKALGLSNPPSSPVYFEALIKTEVIAGAPETATIVATRIIHQKN